MCLICVELKKNSLTSIEARQNLKEMHETIEEDHRLEVLQQIWDKEDEEWEEDEEWDLVGSD